MRFTQKVAIAFKSFSHLCVSANATETEIEKCNENHYIVILWINTQLDLLKKEIISFIHNLFMIYTYYIFHSYIASENLLIRFGKGNLLCLRCNEMVKKQFSNCVIHHFCVLYSLVVF